jgi:MoaA/NifB/PqqE/SkfB family radical SAM enzyme
MYKYFLRKRIPGQLVIQITDYCNARCPQCGMRVTEKFKRSKLPADEVRCMIDAAAQKGVAALSFTGGEPMLFSDELAELIQYAGDAGIQYIRTGTNGFIFMNSDKPIFQARISSIAEKLAHTPLRNFWISIDSAVPSVHEQMRGLPGVIAGIEKALPIFHDHGIYPSANLGINRNVGGIQKTCEVSKPSQVSETSQVCKTSQVSEKFSEEFRSAFRKFYQFVTDLGFTIVNSCYPMSIGDETALNAVYAATSQDAVVKFSRTEKALLFKTLMEVIPEFRSKIRIFSPRTSLYALYHQYQGNGNPKSAISAYPCRGGIDFFFVRADDGNTYPCGYRGDENFGKFRELNLNAPDTKAACCQCDWECFRDPSELFGPVLQGLSEPFELLKKFRNDPQYFPLWTSDLKYYWACDFFNGRKSPDIGRMARYSPV